MSTEDTVDRARIRVRRARLTQAFKANADPARERMLRLAHNRLTDQLRPRG